jgi:ubiquinone/menaquinone biosynthesis C-methylase UbiE
MEKEYDYNNYWDPKNSFDHENTKYYERLYDRIKSKITPESNMRVLDVGGGAGKFLNYLGISNAIILDSSDSGLNIARKRFGFNTIKGDIRIKFPFKNETFDFIYCCEVLEHLIHHEGILQEIFRVLKKEGKLVISVPNLPADGFHHKKRFKKKELNRLLNKCNLNIIKSFYNPKINGGHSFKEIFSDKNARIILKKIISNVLRFIIPLKFKLYLANKNPDKFSGFFIIKAQK